MGLNIRELVRSHLSDPSHFFSIFTIEKITETERFNMNYMKFYSYRLLEKWRKLDNTVCVLALIGYVFSLIEYELCFSEDRTYHNCVNSEIQALRWLTMLSSAIASVIVCIRFKVQSLFYKIQSKNAFKLHYRSMFKRKTFLLTNLFFEFFILWIFPLPLTKFHIYVEQVSRTATHSGEDLTYNLCYTYSEFAFISMGMRFYFILKFVLKSSSYRDMFATYFCNKYNTRAGFRFALKSLMARHQCKVFFLIVFPSLLLLAEVLRVFERPYSDISDQNFDSYENAIWCLITTMSTIGYGDLAPETSGGRFICLISTFWGGFSLSWVIIFLSSWVYLSPDEERTMEKIDKRRKMRGTFLRSKSKKKDKSELMPAKYSGVYSDLIRMPKKKKANELVSRLIAVEEKLDCFLSDKVQ